LGAGIRPYAILGKPNENIMDKRNNSYSVSHPRIYAENGFSTKMVGVVSVEQEMEKKTEPLV
jgi:hypothetical protein